MNDSTFNATGFYQLIEKINQGEESICEHLASMSKICYWSENNYASEDSYLASVFDSLSKTIDHIEESIHVALRNIKSSLNKYVDDTIANESNTQKNLDGMNDTLASINNQLETMFDFSIDYEDTSDNHQR